MAVPPIRLDSHQLTLNNITRIVLRVYQFANIGSRVDYHMPTHPDSLRISVTGPAPQALNSRPSYPHGLCSRADTIAAHAGTR
jgi:hypothetical protein